MATGSTINGSIQPSTNSHQNVAELTELLELWDVVCVTCQGQDLSMQIEKDLRLYQEAGLIAKNTEIVVVADPKSNIGSGGATFNAILTIAERLSIRLNYSVVNINAMRNQRILIMHMGRDFQFDVAGRGLFYLPCTFSSSNLQLPLPNYMHTLLVMTQHIAVGSPPGVWVSSTDIIVSTSADLYKKIDWSKQHDMLGIAVPTPIKSVANLHAAYRINEDGYAAEIYYKASREVLKQEAAGSKYCSNPDDVLALLGIVYLSPHVRDLIFSFYEVYPLNSCTYMGVDSGANPIPLSILMDVMRAACIDVSCEEFVNRGSDTSNLAKKARQMIYEKLGKYKYSCVVDEGCSFLFPDVDRPTLLYETLRTFTKLPSTKPIVKCSTAHSFIESKVDDTSCIIINSLIGASVRLGSGTVIAHSLIEYPAIIGAGSIITGLEAVGKNANSESALIDDISVINVPPEIALHQYAINLPCLQFQGNMSVGVVIVFGLRDKLDEIINMERPSGNTFCNMPLKSYLESKKIDETDLWPHSMLEEEKTLFTARLFPVLSKVKTLSLALWLASPHADTRMLQKWRASWRLSIKELQKLVDHESQSRYRHACLSRVGCKIVGREIASSDNSYLLPLYQTSVLCHFADRLLSVLDVIASQSLDELKLARVLANIAALLAAMSGARGGIRSGPSKNTDWESAYGWLLSGDNERAVRSMALLRQEWMDSPQMLMRASRHYEGACHILIRRACQTAQNFIFLQPCQNAVESEGEEKNPWVIAESPCRADFSGGWTDTPPMSYEIGGSVLNVAININGQKPIGARIRKSRTPGIVVCNLDVSADVTTVLQKWKFDSIEAFTGLDHPYGQAILQKACLVVAGVVRWVRNCLNPKSLLVKQLVAAFGKPGIEIHTWASLPEGSGLGTRSILAGALIAAIWTLSGQTYDMECVCHAVIQCEQLMVTCGGWQDPIGGLVGGIKLAYCQPQLPLHVRYREIGSHSPTFLDNLNRHLVLIYAGNRPPFGSSMVVFNVVRNWYSNKPSVIEATWKLAALAREGAEILEREDIDALGPILTESNHLKKVLAPGSESESFRQISELLKPISYGATINGCGDGGFMTVLVTKDYGAMFSKKKDMLNDVQRIIAESGLQRHFGDEVAVHDADIAIEGLKVSWQD